MILTVTGNFLVIASYKINRKLRSDINNMFLVSLACSDFVIGLVSMTLYPIYMITRSWFLGPVICDIWLCLDYTLSMASVANLMLICLDRYFSVTRPFTYRVKRTRKKAAIAIILAWIGSFLLWSPPIVIWPLAKGRHVPNNHCYIQFLEEDKILTLVTALLAFYLPVLAMSILYGLIYNQTRKCSQYLEYLKSFRKPRPSLASSPFASIRRSFHRSSTPCASPRSRADSVSSEKQARRRFLSLDQADMDECKPARFRLGSFSNKFHVHKTPDMEKRGNHSDSTTSRLSTSSYIARDHTVKSIPESLSEDIDELPLENKTQDDASTSFPRKVIKTFRKKLSIVSDKSTSDEGTSSDPFDKDASSPLITSRIRSSKTSPVKNNSFAYGRILASEKIQPRARFFSLVPYKKKPFGNESFTNGRQSFKNNRMDSQNNMQRKQSECSSIKMPSSEKKAGRTLSAILLAFFITWLPYNVCAVYKAFCTHSHECVPIGAWDAAYYLCYINSTVNPFCFAMCNKTFRKTFKMILTCKKCLGDELGSFRSTRRRRSTYRPSVVVTQPHASSSSSGHSV